MTGKSQKSRQHSRQIIIRPRRRRLVIVLSLLYLTFVIICVAGVWLTRQSWLIIPPLIAPIGAFFNPYILKFLSNVPAESNQVVPPAQTLYLTTSLDVAADRQISTPDSTPNTVTVRSADTLPPIWHVPYQHNEHFTGREDLLSYIHMTLLSGNGVQPTQSPKAICGLGGIGKTQTAIEYAYRYHHDYEAVLWVRAEAPEIFISDFVAIADLLDLSAKIEKMQKLAVNAVKGWLAEHTRWLLILDNVEDLMSLEEFLPLTGKGHILLTTRTQATAGIIQRISLEQMGQEEGALLLLRRAAIIAHDAPFEAAPLSTRLLAQEISELMGGLPLALDQAGAYIEETQCGLDTYLDLYRTRCVPLLKVRSGPLTRQVGRAMLNHPEPVATTWSLSFEKVKQRNAGAAELLQLCAFLHPDSIPEEIIIRGTIATKSNLGRIAADSFAFNNAIGELRKYSLLGRDPAAKTLSMHNLVQIVLKDTMTSLQQQQWAVRAVKAVNAVFPTVDFRAWPACQRCLPHALVCAELIQQWQMTFPEASRLLSQTGNYLQERAQYTQAEQLLIQSLTIRKQIYGPAHPDIAMSLKDLALLYYNQGKYERAEGIFTQALTMGEQTLGPAHPDVATYLNLLGWIYFNQGKYVAAEPLYLRALTIRQQLWGAEHLDVAQNLNNLALLYRSQAQYARAEEYFQRALAIRKRCLGDSHPYVATSLNDLAWLYRTLGRYKDAESLYAQVIKIRQETLGNEHPHTATCIEDLAVLYMEQGRYKQAEMFYKHVLATREQTQGPENYRVAITLSNLAAMTLMQGRYAQAEALYKRTLVIRETAFGADHPYVAISLEGLAEAYRLQGQFALAEPLYLRALAIRKHVLGDNHPHVAVVLYDLAMLYSAQDLYASAEDLFNSALAVRKRVFGNEHPLVALSLYGLAELYRQQGHLPLAEALYKQALSTREKMLGPDHYRVAVTLHGLAQLYCLRRRYRLAKSCYERARSIAEQAVGPVHPFLVVLLADYASLLRQTKQRRAAALLDLEIARIKLALAQPLLCTTDDTTMELTTDELLAQSFPNSFSHQMQRSEH